MERPCLPEQAPQDQKGGDILGNDGGDGYPRHVQMKNDDQQQVQAHIDDSGYGQIVQGPPGVAPRPEEGGQTAQPREKNQEAPASGGGKSGSHRRRRRTRGGGGRPGQEQ